MTFWQKLALVVSLGAVVGILRETGIVSLDLYHSTINTHEKSSWNNNSTVLRPNMVASPSWLAEVKAPCNVEGQINKMGVSVLDREQTDTARCNTLEVKITELHPGAIWVPLIKYTSFSAKAVCHSSFTLVGVEDGKMVQSTYWFNGEIDVTGHATILGISSYRNALGLIKKEIVSLVRKDAQNQLKP